jgi:phospholipid/cholesterol/gamma-HCH transport system ATP-binding protein
MSEHVQSDQMLAPNAGDNIILSARGISVAFGEHKVLENLDLDVHRGEILGFVGASGTGKSVLMRTMLRLIKRQAGRVQILGKDYDAITDEERIAIDMRLGVLFQQGALFFKCRCVNI